MKIVVAGGIIQQVKAFSYLGRMSSEYATEIKRRIATAASIWFEIWGVVDPGKKKFDLYRQISEKFQFFQAILQKNIEFCRQISENFDFFRQLKKFDFQAKNCPFTATSGQIILFIFKSNHFRTYLM